MSKVLFLITTESNLNFAQTIARRVIEKKLAACVSIKKISSFYNWEGKIEHCEEFEISIKSVPNKLNELIDLLKDQISYKLPQFIYRTFDSEENYFNWVNQSIN